MTLLFLTADLVSISNREYVYRKRVKKSEKKLPIDKQKLIVYLFEAASSDVLQGIKVSRRRRRLFKIVMRAF